MRIALLAAVIAIVPVAGFAQNPAGVDLSAIAQDSAAAARDSLATLSSLAKGENAQRLGFESPGDAERSELGTPISDFVVQLDELRSWQSNADPMSLLHSTGLVTFPVKAGGAVRSSITLKKQDNGWRAVAFGAPAQTRAVVGTREGAIERARVRESETFQVRIPAFNLIFVGYVSNSRLMLTPVMDAEQYELTAGVAVPADQLFTRLKPEAERDHGQPR